MRTIREIAHEIENTWENVSVYAQPYLDAMFYLDSVNDKYICDSGKSIVLYFLANAGSWHGDDARRIKAELKVMCK